MAGGSDARIINLFGAYTGKSCGPWEVLEQQANAALVECALPGAVMIYKMYLYLECGRDAVTTRKFLAGVERNRMAAVL